MNWYNFLILISIIKFVYSIKLSIREANVDKKFYIERDKLLTLTCETDSISQKEIVQWFLPSGPITPVTITDSKQRVSVSEEVIGNMKSFILTVRDVSDEFSGQYSCRSYQYEGNSQILLASAVVLVSLFKPIREINCLTEQWIMANSTSLILCELESEPKALVTWEFKNVQLTQSEKYKMEVQGLTIYNVQPSDAGQYVLKARSFGTSSSYVKDILVTTYEIPKITVGPRIIGPVTDGVVEYWYSDIQCLATGNPMPTVHWFRKKNGNQELQIYNPQKFFANTNPKVGTLRISWPVYPDDNDEYTCQAMIVTSNINNFNFPKEVVSKSINISVSVRPEFTQLEQMTQIIDPGKTAFIRCRVRTTDPVKLQWQRYLGEAYTMGVQASDPRIKVTLEKELYSEIFQVLRLEISNVRYSDSWNYTCIATSPGYNYSYNGTIIVRQRPILSNKTLTVEYGWLFNATNMTCIAHGLPQPTRWFWYRNRISVLNDINSTFRIISYDYEIRSQSWLQVTPDLSSQYWIYDLYECQAQNEVGEDRKTIRFLSAQIPGPPIATFINTTSSSLAFKLVPSTRDGGMKLMHYEMVYRALEGPTTLYGPVIYQPDETTINLDGLMFNTNYQVSFYSCNVVGRSYDTTVNGRTLSATVPYAVKIISRRESGYPYGYNVEWEVPLNGGHPIIGYRIFIQNVDVPGSYIGNNNRNYLVYHPELLSVASAVKIFELIVSNPYDSVYRLDDLEASTIYRLSIEAKNKIGYSNKTIFHFYTPVGDTLGKPARVRGFQAQLQPTISLYLLIIFIFYFII